MATNLVFLSVHSMTLGTKSILFKLRLNSVQIQTDNNEIQFAPFTSYKRFLTFN